MSRGDGNAVGRFHALAAGSPRTLASVIAGMAPGSRAWDRLLDRVAVAGSEHELVAALELTLKELKKDIATWSAIASSTSDISSTAAE